MAEYVALVTSVLNSVAQDLLEPRFHFRFERFVHRMSPSVVKTSHLKLYGLAENQSQEGSG